MDTNPIDTNPIRGVEHSTEVVRARTDQRFHTQLRKPRRGETIVAAGLIALVAWIALATIVREVF